MKATSATWTILAMLGAASSSAAARQPGTATIRGVALANGTNEPIAGAWVLLHGFGAKRSLYADFVTVPTTPSAMTDRDGRFEIRNIVPGAYTLAVLRNGYAKTILGQRVEGGTVPPLEVRAGGSRDVVVHMTPTGSVSGVIRNTSGRPMAGTDVHLIRRVYAATGHRRLSVVASTTANDRGEYRFCWITPGRYYVRAGRPPRARGYGTSIQRFDEAVDRGNNEVRDDYGETYYPGAGTIEHSAAIDVRPRSEIQGVDIVMERRRPVRLHAEVIDSRTGGPASGRAVVVESYGHGYGEAFEGGYETLLGPGTFWIGFEADVSILDRQGSKTSKPTAFARVVVAESDLDLVFTLESPPRVHGRVFIDGPPAAAALEQISFQARPEGDVAPTGLGWDVFFSTIRPDVDGAFTLNGIPLTQVRVAPLELPPDFYLKSARLDGVDVLDSAAFFSNGSKLDLVISSRGGRIQGEVRDGRSAPMPNVQVVLVPDVRRDRRELFKSVNTDESGRFSMAGIAPGDYKLFAWEALEPFAWFDPEILGTYESMGTPVHVSESSSQTVRARLIPEAGTR